MNMRCKVYSQLPTVILMTLSAPVYALDTHFGGFGTASLSCFSNDSADYVINTQPEGPGRSSRCDVGLDSLLGVQLDLGFNESFEFGLQVIADRNVDFDYSPEISVAQLRWHPTYATTVRVGRMLTASLLHSEDRQVRYAMPWVRPPQEVYGLMPGFTHDGLDILHQGSLGDWNTEWHGGLTTNKFDTPISNSNDTVVIEGDALFLHLSLQQSNTLFKLGYAYGKISIDSPQLDLLLGGLSMLGPDEVALANELNSDNFSSHFLVMGVRHEQKDWLVMSELGYRNLDNFFREQLGVYITLGKRFGPWMPYTTLARRWTRSPDTDSRVVGAGLLQQGVEALLASSRFDTSSVSLGLSREITEQTILKFQADWIKPDKNSWGLYTNHSADYNFANPDSDWLFALSLDFVF